LSDILSLVKKSIWVVRTCAPCAGARPCFMLAESPCSSTRTRGPYILQHHDRPFSVTACPGRGWASQTPGPGLRRPLRTSALGPTKCCWRLGCRGPDGRCAKCTAPIMHDGLLRHGLGLGVRSSRSPRLAPLRRALRTLRGAWRSAVGDFVVDGLMRCCTNGTHHVGIADAMPRLCLPEGTSGQMFLLARR